MATQLYQLLTAKPTRVQIIFWLGLSLLISLLYSLPGLQEAFSSEYVIQDDARQHVFWMQRFIDPELFPNDVMADYFQSVAPWGYASLYRLFAWVGIDPITLSKILPPILGVIITIYCFYLGLQILPLPFAGFATATLLNQNLWMRDDISSATPGAFFYPIFLAFLYYLLRQSLLPCLITIALQGLFYPQCIFLTVGILLLRLIDWQGGVRLTVNRSQIRFCSIGLGVAFLVMLVYAFKSSEFGSVISAAEAKTLPAFSPTGWSAFFSDNFVDFWLCGKRSGMIPTEWCDLARDDRLVPQFWLAAVRFPSIWLGLLFPVVMATRRYFPVAQRVTVNWMILSQTLLVSISMFLLAHLLAFRLHLPNRYTEHSFRILLALAAGITLVALWEKIVQLLLQWQLAFAGQFIGRWLAVGLSAFAVIVLILYPFDLRINFERFPITGYIDGEHPALYKFLAKQPKTVVIASLTEEANQIPTFAQRSSFVGGEGFVLPYHPKYFQQVNQKLSDLVQAQYSPDLSQVKQFIKQYNIDFWLLDQESFRPDFADSKSYLTLLFKQFPTESEAIKAQLEAGKTPALLQVVDECSAFQKQGMRVLRAKCILKQES